ncbi:hypothetical protein [Undibacterium flavidum]|uniref:Uncharacterized protein n=1 Tax=Undibacterium flavidum TaxID=2762297 RepID=A0ABR6Y7R9_9BURK|nr:hypothetical protein [Undibacterium flavidum]MBC3872658.1 hypothetical protein [Undibacterium flavidum]
MSYVIQIVDAALPGDTMQRRRLIDQLIEEYHTNDQKPDTALSQMYQQLVNRFPCLTSFIDDRIDECVWGDGPLLTNFGERVAVLDIVQRQDEVLVVILKLAQDLNLKVIDAQRDIVFYPKSQESIEYIAVHEKLSEQETSLTEKSVRDTIADRFAPLLTPVGFIWNKKDKWFQRNVSYGMQCIRVGVEKKRDAFTIYYVARFDVLAVGDVMRRLFNDPTATGYIGCVEEYFTKRKLPLSVASIDELRNVTKLFEELTESTVLPFLENSLTLDSLNKALNDTEKCRHFIGRPFIYKVLSLAYLVEPKKIHEVVEVYRNHIKLLNYSEDAYLKPIEDTVNKLIELNPTL